MVLAVQGALDQHQTVQLWMLSFCCGHQAWALAVLEQISAHQELNVVRLEAIERILLTGGSTDQGANSLKQVRQGYDQYAVCAGNHRATVVQDRKAASSDLTHAWYLRREVHLGR